MRPKKKVLLVCDDPHTRSEWKFLLDTWGFLATAVGSYEAPMQLRLASMDFFEVVLMVGMNKHVKAIEKQCEMHPNLRFLGLADQELTSFLSETRWLPLKTPRIEVLDHIKICAARKRGPRKKAA